MSYNVYSMASKHFLCAVYGLIYSRCSRGDVIMVDGVGLYIIQHVIYSHKIPLLHIKDKGSSYAIKPLRPDINIDA